MSDSWTAGTPEDKSDIHNIHHMKDTERQQQITTPFLPPIEEPQDPIMKQAYDAAHQQFGKVHTGLKVFCARMPPEFLEFFTKMHELSQKLTLPQETVSLIGLRVADINGCSFCVDIGRSFVIKMSMNEAKFDAVEQYKTSPLFTDAERALLDYVTELTKNKIVNPETFARLASYYSERQICEIIWQVASEHLHNMTNIGLNIHSDMLCDIARKTR
jgi:alkylhydroperoxidase family enzyme